MLSIDVPSSKRDGKTHKVRLVAPGVWTCDCQDHVYRSHGAPYVCRHISKLALSLATFVSTTPNQSKAAKSLLEA